MTQQLTRTAKKEHPKQFTMVKNAAGGLVVPIEPYDYSAPKRRFAFKFDQERHYLPAKWAVGVFATPEALKQMEKGYFYFENLEALIEMAEENGIYVPPSIKQPEVTVKEIKKALRSNDMKEIDRITNVMTPKIKSDILSAARTVYDSLNVKIIEALEEKLGTSLKAVKLDG